MKQLIINIVRDIEKRKADTNVIPTHAVLMEVSNEIHTRLIHELNEMQRAGIVEMGRTINDKYIKINV